MSQENDSGEPRSRIRRLSERAGTAWEHATAKGQSLYSAAAGRASHVSDQYQNSRAREYVEHVLQQAGQGLDAISGKAMYELVRDRLDLQDGYNDLLASKLQEALDRIDQLERRLADRQQEDQQHGDG